MSEALIIFQCVLTQKNVILRCNSIAKSKSKEKTITLHEIRNVQTLIEVEGQTCFSVFAGLLVLYLNLTLAFWLFLRVPPLAGVGRGCSASKTAFTSVNLVLNL